jgi:hypothetical protein
MKLYAELPFHRARQILVDLFVVAWAGLWVIIGRFLFTLVGKLAEPGRRIEGAGSDIAGTASGAGRRVADVPLVGKYLEAPFGSLERVGQALQDAGQTQQNTVHTLALWIGVLVATLPILFVLFQWGIRRGAWIQQATAAHLVRADAGNLQLFALRAIATRPLTELRLATDDPAGAYNSGNYAPLAALELNQMGLRATL